MPEPQQAKEEGQNQENNHEEHGQEHGQENRQEASNELSQEDREVYNQIFQSINKIGKKVNKAKGKMPKQSHQDKNANFKQIVEKLIESKENSEIINKEDLSSDISQSYERAVVQIYTENQKLKKKIQEMSQIIRQQNHKIFIHVEKQEKLTKQIENLRQQIIQNKDQRVMDGRLKNSPIRLQNSNANNANSTNSQGQKGKTQIKNQNDEDYDFWSMPQNQHGKNKKKQFVQNSALWVNQSQNQKNIGDSMFITQTKTKRGK